MSRETENALLLLVSLSTGLIVFSGAYTRYVKAGLLPWLAATAVLLLVLALAAIVRDIRRGPQDHDDHHGHRGGVAWLLMLPVALLVFVVPPAIGPQTSRPAVAEVSNEVLRQPYPPLPPGRAPELSLPELLVRVARDSAGTLDNRVISVTGFTIKEGERTDLGRVVILCCAADAQLARLHLQGPEAGDAAAVPDGTWVRLEGKIPSGQSISSVRAIPVMDVARVQRVDPPANPYTY